VDVQILRRDSKIDPCDIAASRVRANLSIVDARMGIIGDTFTPDAKIIVSVLGSRSGLLMSIPGEKVRLHDMGRGKAFVLEGHSTGIRGLAFSRDGRVLATGDDHGIVILWNVISGRKLGVIDDSHFGDYLAIGPDSMSLLLGGTDKGIKVWNIVVVDLLHDLKQK
jgi:WD40 repeat protein